MQGFELTVKSTYAERFDRWAGVREIVQNAMDADTLGYKMVLYHNGKELVVRTEGTTVEASAWLLGETDKQGNDALIGEHGDGLPSGTLALKRHGVEIYMDNGDVRWTPTLQPSVVFDGKLVLAIHIRKLRVSRGNNYEVRIGISEEEWKSYTSRFIRFANIDPKDLQTVKYVGSRILDPKYKGQIFKKGIYICTNPDLEFGYDFRNIETNRDRDMVDGWDLKSAISRLMNKIYEEIAEEHPEDLNNVTAKLYENLCDGAEDLSSFGSQFAYSSGSPVVVQIKDHFIQQHGTKARPVENDAEATKISFYGLKGIVVPASLRKILQNDKAFGSTEATMRAAVNTAGEEISTKDLTDSERRNYVGVIRLCYLAGVEDLASLENRIKVYVWTAPDAPYGLYLGKQEIRIARNQLASFTKFLGTVIHEIAHDYGRDGTLAHRSAEEELWEKVSELLIAEAGIGWLAD